MTHPELKQFERVEQLFDNGELDAAYQTLNDSIQYEELSLQQQNHYQFIKGLILMYQNRTDELIKLGEEILNDGELQNDDLKSYDGFFFILSAIILGFFSDEDLFKKFEKADALLEKITFVSQKEYIRRESRLDLLKALTYLTMGELDLTDKHLEKLLHLDEDLKGTFEQVWIYVLMARRMLQGKIQYDLALEYTKKALSLAKNIKFNHFWVALCHVGIGAVNYAIGEFEVSLEHSLKSVAIYKKINNKWYLALTLNNIGGLYAEIEDYNKALNYLQESIALREPSLTSNEAIIDSIITVALNKGDMELAHKYFSQLEQLYHQQHNPTLDLIYKYNKALMLKYSSRIRDKAEAEKLFKQVAETKLMAFDIKIKALIHLCDLYFTEFRLNKSDEVLDDIDLLITKLLDFAEKSHSYLIFCEAFILEARLALIKFELKAARRYLTNAQKVAESHGIKRLAKQISYEHDNLLKNLKSWEDLKGIEAPISERIEFAQIDKQMKHIIKKGQIEIPEVSEEESIFLLIASEGGVPFFSQSFVKHKNFEDHLFGGFFSTINTFINEIFAEGLDRAFFGKYTLLMRSLPPFSIFYIYKGQSYSAQHRIKAFADELKNNQEIWENIDHFYQTNREIKIDDIPSLAPLISKIFIDKSS
jgi:tetratricopeptide (TPR) repeat protein